MRRRDHLVIRSDMDLDGLEYFEVSREVRVPDDPANRRHPNRPFVASASGLKLPSLFAFRIEPCSGAIAVGVDARFFLISAAAGGQAGGVGAPPGSASNR